MPATAPTDVTYLVPAITAAGTVLAAIITGFLAAVLKHRWDIAADKQKYERELAQRWDVDLRQLYAKYLAEARRLRDDSVKRMDGSPTIPDAKPFLQLQEEMELIAPDQALQEARSLKDAVMDLWSEAAQGKTSEPERFATYLASIDKFTQAARVSLGRAESKQDKGQ